MLFDISESVHIKADRSNAVDRDIKDCTEGDGKHPRDDKVAKSQKWKGEPTGKKNLSECPKTGFFLNPDFWVSCFQKQKHPT